MSDYTKYTKELLEPLVKESISVSEVLRKLGKNQTGSVATHVSKCIKKFGIDTSHFLGQAANCGDKHKGGPERRRWDEVLVVRNGDRREKAWRLRRAMIEAGIPYECAICGLPPQWNGQELRLHVDHKDGNFLDCRIENVRFTCPNCHAQQVTWGCNKELTDLTSAKKQYKKCRLKEASSI